MKILYLCPDLGVPVLGQKGASIHVRELVAAFTRMGHAVILAAPVLNGLQAVTQNFINAQTYSGATPAIGFVSPVLYQLGNSPNYTSYYRDVQCGNTANPTSGPDGDAAGVGWDAATGWGEPDWYNFSIGYARALGATNLSVPPSTSRNFPWICAKTPSNNVSATSGRRRSFPGGHKCQPRAKGAERNSWWGCCSESQPTLL